MNKGTMERLLKTAKGLMPPDCVIRNGRVVNVFTNAIEEGLAIAIKDGYIVSAEEDRKEVVYPAAPVVDAGGAFLCPGFIDSHTHLDSMLSFSALTPFALRGGTTTVVTETSMAACTCGLEGVMALVESTRGYPLRCYFLAPPLTPPFPGMEGSRSLTMREFRRLLKRDDFVGIGEAYWTRIVEGDDRVLGQACAAMAARKALDGHAAGARGRKLVEYVLTGITSCHESTTVEEAMEKLRHGVYVMIRDGWVRRELEGLAPIARTGVDTRRLMLVSDVFDAGMLMAEGYLDSLVRKAIGLGFTAIEAIKMVTINPADYYGLRHLGAIAPLRKADILFLSDLEQVSIDRVMADGEFVVAGGGFTKTLPRSSFPAAVTRSITAEHVTPQDLMTATSLRTPTVRVIELSNQTITRQVFTSLAVRDGLLQKDLEQGIIPVAVINRRDTTQMGKGFVKGAGITCGAVATTLIWDTGNILAVGSSEEDMALAANRLMDLQGGVVMVREGKVIFEFAMPVFGIMSPAPLEEVERKIRELEEGMRRLGSTLEKPFLTLQTISFTGLPFLRITDKGLADIKEKRLVPLLMEG